MRTAACTLAVVLSSASIGAAYSQAYPTRPVRMIVAFAPGGGSDTAGRIVAQHLAGALGQQVVVDNRPGASGMLGHEIGARATPDGHTIMWTSIGPCAVNVSLFKKIPYDTLRDFEPVTLSADSLNALVVHPRVPATNVKEFIAFARSKPGAVNYGSSGYGGAGHLAGELFDQMTGAKTVHIAYKGGGPAMIDLLGGQIEAIYATLATALPHIRSGRIRGLGVTRKERAPMIPELPTISEAGLPGYEATNWYGILVPAGTPRPIVQRLNRELVKILQLPDVRDRYFKQGMLPLHSTPEAFRAHIKSEIEKWGKVIRTAGITAG